MNAMVKARLPAKSLPIRNSPPGRADRMYSRERKRHTRAGEAAYRTGRMYPGIDMTCRL